VTSETGAAPDPDDVAFYDAQAARAIGGPRPLSGPVEIHEYDSMWPVLYAREAEQIRGALGDRVVRLEHVGSTSVPGLAAKPVVDIALEVPDTRDEDAYVADLEAAGYTLRIREPEWFEHRLLKRTQPPVNLHVFSAGCEETDKMLLFRDWSPATQRTATCTCARSERSRRGGGSTSNSTPTRRPPSSTRSWRAPPPDADPGGRGLRQTRSSRLVRERTGAGECDSRRAVALGETIPWPSARDPLPGV